MTKIEKIKYFIQTGNTVTISITFTLSFFSFDSTNFFNFINIFELISIISLFDLDIPEDILELLRHARVQKSIPNAVSKMIKTSNTSKTQPKYVKYGFDSSLCLVNSGNALFILATISIAFLFQRLFLFRFAQNNSKLKFIFTYFQYNIFFKYWLQTSLELLLTTSYGFNLIFEENSWPLADFILRIVIFVFHK